MSSQGPRRAQREVLSVDRIVSATLALIDEQGIGSASMRVVASRLGVRAVSLYKHVANRDELLDAVVERIVDELADDPDVQQRPTAGWRAYLESMAHGVRRYARRHPHAFPLVATRPPSAPWLNPPLRSVRWVETLLSSLSAEGFDDDEVVFAYRVFNSFLLGFLLLETSAMALADPLPGDGTFASGDAPADSGGASTDPVPGGLSPTRDEQVHDAIAGARDARGLLDPAGDVPADHFPTVHRLASQLAADEWDHEFDNALKEMLDRIERTVAQAGRPARDGG